MKTIVSALLVLLLVTNLFAKESRLPDAVLCSHSIAVLARPYPILRLPYFWKLLAPDRALIRQREFEDANLKKEAAEKSLRSGEFQLVQDPNEADLVLVIYLDGLGVIMTGGAQPWNPAPLWIVMGIREAEQVAKMVRSEVAKERKNHAPCTVQKAIALPRTPGPEDATAEAFPKEILNAKTVAVIEYYPPWGPPLKYRKRPSANEKTVARQLKEWGRFDVLADSTKAELILAFYTAPEGEFGLLAFPNSDQPNWKRLPLWRVTGYGIRIWDSSYAQPNLVKDLQKDVAKAEEQSSIDRSQPRK